MRKKFPNVPMQLRRIVVRLLIKPNLSFFDNYNAVGVHFHKSGEFTNWLKGAVSLALRNVETHSLFQIASRELLLVLDSTEHNQRSFDQAAAIIAKSAELLKLNETLKLIVQGVYTRAIQGGFEAARESILRIAPPVENLVSIAGDSITDLAYKFVGKNSESETHLHIGPMKREEWFSAYDYQMKDFNLRVFENEEAFAKYVNAFEEAFIHFDVTRSREAVAVDALESTIKSLGAQSIASSEKFSALIGARHGLS